MDTAQTQSFDRLSALEQENAMLQYLLAQQSCSHLQRHEQFCAVLQAKAEYRRREQVWQEQIEAARQQGRAITPGSRESPVETQRERILTATTAVANALLTVENFNQAVNIALQIVGNCLTTDRVAIIENFKLTGNTSSLGWRLLYEWNSADTISQISHPDFAQGSYEGIEDWYSRLNQGQSISCSLENMPEPFRSGQAAIGVKTLHVVPIFVEGKFWGNVGFDDCREAKYRSPAELSLLRIAADCIGSAIQRERIQQALLQAEQKRAAELAQVNQILQQREHELQRSYRLLSTVAQVTKDLLEAEDVDVAIPAALRAVGEVANMSRVQLLLERQDSATQKLQHFIAYEWVAEGIIPQIDHPSAAILNNDDFEFILKELSTGRSVWHIIDDLPSPIRTKFESIGIQSSGTVPIFIKGRYVGGVGFDDCVSPRQWSQQEIDVLTTAAESIGAALHRKQLVNRLIKEQIHAEQERAAELAKANHALKQSLDSLAAKPELETFLGHVLHAIAEQFGAPMTEYWFHPDDTAYIGMMSWQGRALNRDALVQVFPHHPGLDGFKVPPSLIRAASLQQRKEYIIYEDHSLNSFTRHLPWIVNWLIPQGLTKEINMPMVLGDTTIGALVIRLPQNHHFTPQQIELAQALAHQATLAIHLTQLAEEAKQAAIAREQEKAAQQQAAELARANTLLRNSLSRLSTNPNLQDVLGHLLVELVRYAGASVGHIFLHDATQNTLSLRVRCQDEQAFWMPADDEPVFFQSPISIGQTPIFTYLCTQPRLAVLNQNEFEGRLWPGILEWFQAKGYQGTCSCVLMVGDRPFGMLTMAFSQPIAFRSVEEELILALTQQIALVLQLTTLGEADKQAALAKLNEVIAREQEQSAQERAVELAKANSALKHSLDRLAQEPDLLAFLGHVLREIARQVQAAAGHIFLLDVETNTLELCLEIQNGQLYRKARPDEPALFQSAVPADITPIFQYLCQKRTLSSLSTGEFEGMTWAGTSEWSEREGFTEVVCLALIVGDQPVGLLGLAFRGKSTLKPEEAELIHALAHQATLAIQLTRLAEEAKRVAIFAERNRMASEIHDTLAQVFTGISLQLEVAKPLVQTEPETVERILEHIKQLTETGLAEARRSVWALYPPAAEYADLAQLLYNSVEHMTRNTAIAVEVNVQGEPCSLSPFIGMNLLRIGQEALTNALKHAQAQKISIELSYEPDRVWLTLCDDGRGFTPPTHIDSLNGGFGLVGMYERCDRIGAQLSISSQPGQGTQILIEAPLS